MRKRDTAKRLLQHYFSMSIENFESDCHSEVADIVDLIIDAAKEELKEELREVSPPDWMQNERDDHERFEANE